MADLHPVTAASIDANRDGANDFLCGCWKGTSGMMHLCEFHQGMETALYPEVLAAAGWRLVREDDVRWLVDNLNWAALGDPYSQAGDDLPTGVRVLLDEMEGE